jgi:hypothetical protein
VDFPIANVNKRPDRANKSMGGYEENCRSDSTQALRYLRFLLFKSFFPDLRNLRTNSCKIRVSSVFNPWLKLCRAGHHLDRALLIRAVNHG